MSEKVIDANEVERIAALARLVLAPEEIEPLTRDLAAILRYVDKIAERDTTGVEPTTHAVELQSRLRADEAAEPIDVELALREAPERLGDGFGVPKIIE